ncbi:MAG TPA: hypothetical protein VD867_00970 [Burkholderiales bacterium]|nr:hypothetical protein [Burkholderiales bacterium]
MFGLQWGERFSRKSTHPMADAAGAAQLIRDLPVDNAAAAIGEAAAWLESIEPENFAPNHRLNLVSMIDEAVIGSVEALTLTYLGAKPGTAGQGADWRILTEYLDRVSDAYARIVEASAELKHAEFAARIPVAIVRSMRSITLGMKVSWLRYLPPDRGSWEALVRCYRDACARNAASVTMHAYPTDSEPTSALQELAVGVMLGAAAPQGLTPRQVEIAYRAVSTHRKLFTVSIGRDAQPRHYLFDLDNPETPARVRAEVPPDDSHMFFGGEAVVDEVRPIVAASTGARVAMMPAIAYGDEFGAGEKLVVLKHLLRFWGPTPPSRRDERRRVNTKIHVEVGAAALRTVLARAAAGPNAAEPELDGVLAPKVGAADQGRVTPFNSWTLTDFSSRGIGARFTRRLDRWLGVGALVGFRLERSEKWCVGVVRRLRTDSRSQTDVGCEIVAKEACLVELEGMACTQTGALWEPAGGSAVRSTAVMLPEDTQLATRPSLLFDPATAAPVRTFIMHKDGTARRIQLGAIAERIDGWDRVEFDYLVAK